jgi:hypothetical protein
MLEALGMNPSAIAPAQIMVSNRLILCLSAQRRIKEEAMISSAEKRFLAAAAALGKSIEKGVFKRAAIIKRKIGALQKRHARTARFHALKQAQGSSACLPTTCWAG